MYFGKLRVGIDNFIILVDLNAAQRVFHNGFVFFFTLEKFFFQILTGLDF